RLEGHLSNRFYALRQGSTDSELLFLLALQMGLARDVHGALSATINLVAAEAAAIGIHPMIRFTAALSDGETLYAVRYATDGKAPSLFAHVGGDGACRLVSEPLDGDSASWTPVPEGSFVSVNSHGFYRRGFEPLASSIAMAV
ncbi:MAG: class II glutamine amidotransferase, partial [Notoacmeibacter sp.]|nr:class II glutamine amidotransferase [Notoacmeibacter sp.]